MHPKGLVSKVVIPAALSPIIAALVAALGTWLLYRISRSLTRGARNHGFRIGQVGSACMVSLAHGTNDAQKTMGVITLALIANGTLATGSQAPFWVILSCAIAISLGTYLGGWRVIRTLGKGLVEIESPQGMAAESSSAAIILLSASFGYSLSTTHVATGSIIGTGLGKKGADVRWSVAGRMATAWLFTLPAAGVAGALAYWLAHGIGGSLGVIILLAILAGLCLAIYWRSRTNKVDHSNVNDEWTGASPRPNPSPRPRPERQGSNKWAGSISPPSGRSWCSACSPGPACPRCSPSGCAPWSCRAAGSRPPALIRITCTAATCWA
jgi:inorganic phosphate transporter, PiT family